VKVGPTSHTVELYITTLSADTDRPNSLFLVDPSQRRTACTRSLGIGEMRFIDRTIGQWRRRLECVFQHQGGHIEHFDIKTADVTVELL